MNAEQIAFAARHDWFVSAKANGNVVVVERWTNVLDGTSGDELLTFSNFAELRAWAGY